MSLDPAASRYVSRVHRLGVGDLLQLFAPDQGLCARARVLKVGPESVRCEVSDLAKVVPSDAREVTLVQGLAKGDKLDAIVRDCTELGVRRIIPLESSRSVVKLGTSERGDSKRESRAARLRRIAVEAARQCGRGDVPEIVAPVSLQGLGELPCVHSGLRFVCWEDATLPISQVLSGLDHKASVTFVVGPEGGLSADEVHLLEGWGFAAVSLGPLILRTETVAPAVLGALFFGGQ